MAEVSLLPKPRYLFIDLYRSAVIVLMLEGHVFRAFLNSESQHSTLFNLHEFFHGLSAPAFLFGSGLTYVISTRKRWEDYHHWDPPLARRLRRLLFVIILGLALHLPYFSIRKIIIDGTTADYLQLFQCDVLHCIGIGLLSLHALVFFFKTESKFYGLVIATIITVCFLTPLVWDIDFLHYTSPAFAQLFNTMHGSPFPLFPSIGFLFSGVIVSWEYLVAAEQKRERDFMLRLAITGGLFILAGIIFDALPVTIYPTYNFWYTSPNYFFIRAGSLMMLSAGFWYVATHIGHPRTYLTVFGKESLFVYVLHLVILYGSAVNPESNLQQMFGAHLGFIQTSGVFLLFTATMLVAAMGWNYLKEKHYHDYRAIQLVGAGIFLYYFFTQNY